MTVEELIVYGNQDLHKDEVQIILSTILGINPLELSINLEKVVDDELVSRYRKVVAYKKEGKPIQYALNNACFYGYDFYIDERVLIPRFETEELVYHTIDYLNKYFDKPKVLDMCAGSGCIGITLKKECPDIAVTFADISADALDVLKRNKERLDVIGDVVLTDLFDNISEQYDCIICNPPYVGVDDVVDDIVKKYEPSVALYAGNNGLAVYERFFKECEKYLKDKYLIALEIGESQGLLVEDIAKMHLLDSKIIIKKDAAERDRMVFVFKNIEINE